MAYVWIYVSTLLMATGMTAAQVEEMELRSSLDEEACSADGDCSALELRQLRGERLSASLLEKEGDAGTCAAWFKLPGAECDDSSEVAIANPESVECADDCSSDTCCQDKASCDFFTVVDGCAKVPVPANVTDMVWAPKEADLGDDLFCALAERDAASCGESCCELKPCTKCTGATYLTGCEAGNVGECTDCPAESSCAAGQHQSCGDGTLSACTPCENAPSNAHYTGSSLTSTCPWECDEGYDNIDGTCVSKACEKWNGTCDANTTEPRELSTPCSGHCSEKVCCAPRCVLHTCSKGLASVAKYATKVASTDQACCQSVGCEDLSVKTAVVWPTGCDSATDEAACESTYQISGNVHKSGTGSTVFTSCSWNAAKAACGWAQKKYRDCIL